MKLLVMEPFLTALYEPNTQKSFKVSEDKDAQQKLKEILTTYTN